MGIKAVVALSGGMDSTVMLHHILSGPQAIRPDEVMLVNFNYGSKHNPFEIQAAEAVRQWMSIPLLNRIEFDLRGVFQSMRPRSALLADVPVPEGHYNDDTMKQTVVPGRNLMFVSIMASLAETLSQAGSDSDPRSRITIYLGVHQGDHYIYPDCRPKFVYSADDAVWQSTDGWVRLHAPFLSYSKVDIVRRGLELGTPFGLTRTCYKNQPIACGKCGSCRERLEAFTLNNHTDFIEYEDATYAR